MANLVNHEPRLRILPPLKCKITGKSLKGVSLSPGSNYVPDEYVKQALGLADGDQFVLTGDEPGHAGVLALEASGVITLKDEDPPEEESPLKGISVKDSAEIIANCSEVELFKIYRLDGRKGVQEMVESRAEVLEIDLPGR